MADASLVLRHIVGLAGLDAGQKLAVDVNDDGKVNVADAILVLRYIVGLLERFPIEIHGNKISCTGLLIHLIILL